MRKSVLLGMALLLLSSFAVAACSNQPGGAGGPTDGMTPKQTIAEFVEESGRLTLAPGWRWDPSPKVDTTGPDGRPMMYQKGFGRTKADWYWFCSWGQQALAPSATDADRTAAMAELKKIRGLFYYNTALLPPDRATFDAELKKAELGDLSTLRTDIQLNCPARSA
jgi:predicted small secreted protein